MKEALQAQWHRPRPAVPQARAAAPLASQPAGVVDHQRRVIGEALVQVDRRDLRLGRQPRRAIVIQGDGARTGKRKTLRRHRQLGDFDLTGGGQIIRRQLRKLQGHIAHDA